MLKCIENIYRSHRQVMIEFTGTRLDPTFKYPNTDLLRGTNAANNGIKETGVVSQSFWKFAQSTAVSLPCSVQNFKKIWLLINKLWVNEISRDLDLRSVSDGYPILHSTPGVLGQAAHLIPREWRPPSGSVQVLISSPHDCLGNN